MRAIGCSNTPTLLLWIKMKCGVVLFRHKGVGIGRRYRLFPRAKRSICLWVLLLLSIVLASLWSMVRNLWNLIIFECSLLNYLFILRRFCRYKPVDLSLANIATRKFSLFSSNQIFLTGLLSLLHRAFNFAALPRWNCPLLILCACVKVLSGKLLLINVCRHRWESFHVVPLFHELSHWLSRIILDRITILLVKDYSIII